MTANESDGNSAKGHPRLNGTKRHALPRQHGGEAERSFADAIPK